MADMNSVMVDADAEQIISECHKAIRAANGRATRATLCWSASAQSTFRLLLEQPDGWKQWLGESGPPSESESILFVAWWTDPLGRRHVRILADRLVLDAEMRRCLVWPQWDVPPAVALVYPNAGYWRFEGDNRRWMVLCPCGMSGTPAEIGWMGDCCAACHDRREEETPRPQWFASFPATNINSQPTAVVGLHFFDESRSLVVSHGSGQAMIISREDGSTRPLRLTRSCVAVNPVEPLCACMHAGNAIEIFDADWQLRESIVPRGRPLAWTWSPDGASIAVLGLSRPSVFIREIGDWQHFEPAPGGLSLQQTIIYSEDGQRLAALTTSDELVIWNTTDGAVDWRLSFPEGPIVAFAFSPDNETMALLVFQGQSLSGMVLLYDLFTKQTLRTWQLHRGIMPFSLVYANRDLLLGQVGREVHSWDVSSGTLLARIQTGPRLLNRLAISGDRTSVALGDNLGVVRQLPLEAFE
jgi:hypothetical protein